MTQKSVIIESNGIVQQLYLKYNLKPENLQEILSVVYKIQSQSIVALIDDNNIVYDLECFCQNLSNFDNNKQFNLLLSSTQEISKQNSQTEANNHTFSKDRGQSQLGKRQRVNYHQQNQSQKKQESPSLSYKNKNIQIETEEEHRGMSRSQSILRILPEKVSYFEDFEFFIKTTQHENPNTFYLIWFFDVFDKMKEYNFMSNTYIFNNLPVIQHFTGLYPSFRSRPFGKYDDTFCLSFFKGDQLLFERDLQYNSPVPKSIVYLIEENIEHPRPIHTSTPRNWYKNRSNSQHSQNIQTTPTHNNDYTFEAIETFSQNSIRSRFTDSEFKEILRMVRKHNKMVLSAYESFKIDHDEYELHETVKKILQSGESNLDVSFDKEDSSNFIPLKSQAQSVNMFTNTPVQNNSNENNSNSPSYQVAQNMVQNSEYLEDINNYINFPIFFMKQYFRDTQITSQFSYEEKALILLAVKKSNPEIEEYIKSLIQDRVLKESLGVNTIKNLAKNYTIQTYEQIFPQQVIDEINNKKFDKFSFVQGALCHLITHGNLDKFKEIILENTEDPIISPIPNKNQSKASPDQYFINIQKEFIPNEPSPNQKEAQQIPFPSIQEPLQQSQSDVQECQQVHSLFGRKNSPQILHVQQQEQFSPATSYTQNQINLFNSTSSPKEIERQIIRNALNRGSNSFDSTHQSRKQSFKSSSRFDQQDYLHLPVYSSIAREKRRERKPTFSLINKNEMMHTNQHQGGGVRKDSAENKEQEQKQKQNIIKVKMLDQQTNLYVEQYHQNTEPEKMFDLKNQLNFEQIISVLDIKQRIIAKEMYKARIPELVQFLENMRNNSTYLTQNQQEIESIINKNSIIGKEEEFEPPVELNLTEKEVTRLEKYKSYRKILKYLHYIDHYISMEQYQFFNYLYIKENIQALGAFEVYMVTNNIPDFVESLQKIMQFYFFKKEFSYEELEGFDDNVEQQFAILFIFRKELSTSRRLALLKAIKLEDQTLLELYRDFKRSTNLENFLKKIKCFADQRIQELQVMEQNEKEGDPAEDLEDQIENNKFTIENFFDKKLIKEVGRVQILLEFVDNQDPRMNAIFELFDFNKDKSEFVENLTLLYKQTFKKNLIKTIQDNKLIEKYPQRQQEKLLDQIQESQSVIFGAYEFYLDNFDLEEFKDSVQRIIETL